MPYDGADFTVGALAPPVVLDPRVRQVLEKARALIAKGWCQNRHRQRVGLFRHAYCIIGATNAVDEDMAGSANRALQRTLYPDPVPSWANSLAGFNDKSTTTKDDVLALFDRTLAQ